MSHNLSNNLDVVFGHDEQYSGLIISRRLLGVTFYRGVCCHKSTSLSMSKSTIINKLLKGL